MTELRRTPLYDIHVARGARIVPFAGYELPVQYAGVVAEHTAVRTAAGLFDVSHMGELFIEGPGASAAVQHAVTNDIGRLNDGAALYTAMCQDDGGIVDDLIVYREHRDRYMLCVNASRRAADAAHLAGLLGRFDCSMTDRSESLAQLALQGPKALEILAAVTRADLAALRPFHFVDTDVAGIADVRIARTGYTGEDGVELYVDAPSAQRLWQAIEAAGAPFGLAPCGLGARDTLRTEMKYALYGNDIDATTNPLEAGLGWVVKLDKGEFVGRAALLSVRTRGLTRRLVGFKMRERGIPRHGYALQRGAEHIGLVTSGTHSPTLGEPIGIGYVAAGYADIGTCIEVIIRERPVAAEIVKTPFYQRGAGV